MNVFIVEDTSSTRVSLQSLLSSIPDVTLVGREADGFQAIACIDELQPDAVIFDIGLQPESKFEALENIKKRHSEIRIIVLTNLADELFINRCRHAGADYFFDKSFQLTQVRAVFWKWAHTDRLALTDHIYCKPDFLHALEG